jgi:hypothetical protein
VRDAGGGEAEGFDEAEELLIGHASHGDSQSAHSVLHEGDEAEERDADEQHGQADHEHSSERRDR